MWADDPVQRRDGLFFQTDQEAVFSPEGNITLLGADRGYGNNSFVAISKIA